MKEYRMSIRHWLTHRTDVVTVHAYDEEEAREVLQQMVGSNWEVIEIKAVPEGGM